ncbi:MAG: dephospho-CoA kinase [Pseudomonadota bacterium]
MGRSFRIGLGGGIGSGKSAAAALFAELGATIVDTDAIAHELTGPGGRAIPPIVEAFGASILHGDGSLDRAALRARVFSDGQAKRVLEAILHPRIREEARLRCNGARGAYVVLVIPLLVEHLAEYRPLLDRIAVVDCPESLQLARAAARSGMDVEQVRAIMATQSSRQERLAIADDVITNQDDMPALARRVAELHGRYATLAKQNSAE